MNSVKKASEYQAYHVCNSDRIYIILIVFHRSFKVSKLLNVFSFLNILENLKFPLVVFIYWSSLCEYFASLYHLLLTLNHLFKMSGHYTKNYDNCIRILRSLPTTPIHDKLNNRKFHYEIHMYNLDNMVRGSLPGTVNILITKVFL